MKKEIEELIGKYNSSCESILKKFCETYELPYYKDAWTAEDVGTVASVGDYFIDLQDMIYMLANDISLDEYLRWYDYNIRANEFNFNLINLRSWHRGAPRVQDETFERLEKMKKDLEDAVANVKNKF